ncbi:MAG: sulfatase [bacterium]|nr:sulfatase [bacterium]
MINSGVVSKSLSSAGWKSQFFSGRRLRYCFLLVALQVLVLSCSASPEQVEQPNFLVVLVDALRADHLGFHGYSKPTSPYLDELAAGGVVFDQAYSHCSKTYGSTASFLTSQLFPTIIRVEPDEEDRERLGSILKKKQALNVLSPSRPSFLEILAEHGYSTTGVLTNPNHHQYSGFPSLFTKPIVLFEGRTPGEREPYVNGRTVSDTYLDWLAGREDKEAPFLAYVHYMDVHWPYDPPQELARRFVTTKGKDRYISVLYRGGGPPSGNDLENMVQRYDAEIAFDDSLIREIHEATLNHCNRETILIVTSDHGEEFMDHGGLGHGRTLEKELIHVPLILHSTDRFPVLRDPNVARQIDVGPTILELAGIEPSGELDGQSLLFRIEDSSKQIPEELLASVARFRSLFSLSTPDWHFISDTKSDSVTLYDNQLDPAGLNDLALEKSNKLQELHDRLLPFVTLHHQAVLRGRQLRENYLANGLPDAPTDETVAQLRALGYLQ